ncbi:BglII/BstYI family type II restriction endonuclease [Komagataeibacter swingsii]|uniref:Restriction endonuclease n=1 Tax=Komagataeibacter swingsii TaxID=215220 RepID=A0A2V4RF82_9PROT|nr:BglII/BstYI family type II restriction endonuclease [Komagataeibacter swingsii]PYD68656.1 hypothetical protein CFR76_13845 [Komagataeibacter swingsii]GBQ57621.1 restriction endonuclease BglII [Komagataeibacter swingsii DSM 16373]
MTKETDDLPKVITINSLDREDRSLFPEGFFDLYEVKSYRNAAQILASSCSNEFRELTETLMKFRILPDDIISGGGNKSKIAKGVENLFHPLGWRETRVTADLLINRVTYTDPSKRGGKAPKVIERYKIDSFVDGHKIDFVKDRVAFDMEWNSKDQTFDRDLYALRSFYECNIISAGILLTRSAELIPAFNDLQKRSEKEMSQGKYGASTTWMGKLTYRIEAGRGGGCPILALGIRPSLIKDFEAWKAANPIRRSTKDISVLDTNSGTDDDMDD